VSPVAYIGFGSNVGDRESKFREALEALESTEEIVVTRFSSLYETEPVGLSDGGSLFLNAAVEVETSLAPNDLLAAIHTIELGLGKSPVHRSNLSRSIDLDLLLYGNQVFKKDELEVPHPRMHVRGFVLVPLAQIAPHIMHPILKCSVKTLLGRLSIEELRGVRLWKAIQPGETSCG
jgi:2-amino-4-hydroxy-6-hydroxymethyldihydropteridine diphosphokinase